VKAGRRGTLA